MAMALITVHCKLFKMMPYIIILKVRKFHQHSKEKTCSGGGGGTIPST